MFKLNREDIVGNGKLLDRLETLFQSGRVPHAVILQGEAGLGKKTLALYIAKALVCTSDNVRPCGKCRGCIQAAAGSHPDISIIEGETKSGDRDRKAISVTQLENLVSDSYKTPENAECRVHLMFAEKPLSEAVQNKLLKIIEEPPPNNYYIITVRSDDSLLTTIRSRAVSFTLTAPDIEDAAAYCERHTKKSHEDCLSAAELFGGNIGRTLTYLSGGKGAEANGIAIAAASLIVNTKTEHEMLKVTFPMIDSRDIFCQVCDLMSEIFRDAVVFASGGKAAISISPETAQKLAGSRSKQRLMKLPDICLKYRRLCEGNGNKKLLNASFCAELRAAVNGDL